MLTTAILKKNTVSRVAWCHIFADLFNPALAGDLGFQSAPHSVHPTITHHVISGNPLTAHL